MNVRTLDARPKQLNYIWPFGRSMEFSIQSLYKNRLVNPETGLTNVLFLVYTKEDVKLIAPVLSFGFGTGITQLTDSIFSFNLFSIKDLPVGIYRYRIVFVYGSKQLPKRTGMLDININGFEKPTYFE